MQQPPIVTGAGVPPGASAGDIPLPANDTASPPTPTCNQCGTPIVSSILHQSQHRSLAQNLPGGSQVLGAPS